jgi:very-short-patch-repair endonuclease
VSLSSSVPTPTLPRKRERERADTGANASHHVRSTFRARQNVIGNPSIRYGLPPLPLAGEGWGGGIHALEIAMADPKRPTWKVPSRLRSNARALRRNSTDVERIVWLELRDHRLNGASFRRQVPIANYIADFVCHAARLAIELDGGQHFSDEQEQADAARSAVIEAKGYRVLRFSNHDVMTNRVGVLETIAAAIEASAPTPALPRKREREPAVTVATPETKLGVKRTLSSGTAKQEHDARHIEPAGAAPSPACGGGSGWGPSSTVRRASSDEGNGS